MKRPKNHLTYNILPLALIFLVALIYVMVPFIHKALAGGHDPGPGNSSGDSQLEAIHNLPYGMDAVHTWQTDDGQWQASGQYPSDDDDSWWQPDPPPPPPQPPTVSLSAVLNGESYTNNIFVLPVDTVQIQWSSNGDTCQGQLALEGFVTSTNGQFDVNLDDFEVGETRSYEIRCRTGSSAWTSQTIAVTLLGLNMTIELNRTIIRTGETVVVSWNVSSDGSPTAHDDGLHPDLVCDLTGAVRDDIAIQENPSGSRESGPIFNFFENRLRCQYPGTNHVFSVTTPLEVIPSIREL